MHQIAARSASCFVWILVFCCAVPLSAEGLDPKGQADRHDAFQYAVRVRPSEEKIGQMIADLSFKDVAGTAHRLSEFKKSRAVVIAITSTSCPLSKRYLPTLAELEKLYRERGVVFLFVNPIPSDSDEDIRAVQTAQQLVGPYVRDPQGKLLAALGARTTTECFVLDQARTLSYRGAVDDQYGFAYSLESPRVRYLINALESLLAGKTPDVRATRAPGCAVEFEKSAPVLTDVTFHNRISRIMQTHCMECHHRGGPAPFSLETQADVLSHAAMIRQVVERGVMPPWFAAPAKDGTHSPWANDRSLSSADKSDLLHWLQGERAIGNPGDAPRPLKFTDDWKIGMPDLIIEAPEPIPVKATGIMPYQYSVVPTEFEEDLWVQGFEIRPSTRGVLHHASVFVEQVAWHGNGIADERRGPFAVYVPGTSAVIYPEGYAKRLPKGATLRFQVHYAPNGTATADRPRLGLLLSRKPPQHEIHGAGIINPYLRIPAQAENHMESATIRFPYDVQVLALMPHMHVRGKAFRYESLLPDGKSQLLLDVPRYDFNWQIGYVYAQPVLVPRGSAIKATGWFNNSAKNPANPDPNRIVRWGPQTNDEMLLGYVEYVIPELQPGQTVDALVRQRETEAKSDQRSAVQALTLTRDFSRPGSLLKVLDTDHDDKVTLREWNAVGKRALFTKLNSANFQRIFERLDVNQDGALSGEELDQFAPR